MTQSTGLSLLSNFLMPDSLDWVTGEVPARLNSRTGPIPELSGSIAFADDGKRSWSVEVYPVTVMDSKLITKLSVTTSIVGVLARLGLGGSSMRE